MKIGRSNMPLPEGLADVAALLSIDEKELSYNLARVHTLSYEKETVTSSGKKRIFRVGGLLLRTYHKALTVWLQGYIPHKAAHGWRKGRSPITCAKLHVNKKLVMNLDIQDFFPNISHARVRETLVHLGVGDEAAAIITKLVTINGHLPQGFSTSPMLANLVFIRVDARVKGLCDKLDFAYGRYGDDLTLSGNPHRQRYMVKMLRQIIIDSGFSVNEEKFLERGIQPSNKLQRVLGMKVNRKLALTPEKLSKYTSAIDDASTEEIALKFPRLNGYINYASDVNPNQGRYLTKKLHSRVEFDTSELPQE